MARPKSTKEETNSISLNHYSAWGKFCNCEGHVSNKMLNEGYADKGLTFNSQAEALKCRDKNPGSYVSRLVDYGPECFENYIHSESAGGNQDIRQRLKPGALPWTKGWHVTFKKTKEAKFRIVK